MMQLRDMLTFLWNVMPLVSIASATQIKWTKYEFKDVSDRLECCNYFYQDDVADLYECSKICFLHTNCMVVEFDSQTFWCKGYYTFEFNEMPPKESIKLLARLDYYMDCKDILEKDEHAKSGVYEIRLPYIEPTDVYCDMETDGGGWTIIQRRFDSSVDFKRTFEEYENGFGNFNGEFWLGLRYIWGLTSVPSFLRFSVGSYPDSPYQYGIFTITIETYQMFRAVYEGEKNRYLLPVRALFSTYDNDNTLGCARSTGGGWWFSDDTCLISNLNGKNKQNTSYIEWFNKTSMMVRRP